MALPTLEAQEGPKTAPRMDIVVAQVEGTAASIAFWEAKLSNNAELRAQTDYAPDDKAIGPKVLHQLMTYRSWIEQSDRSAEVMAAYQNLAQLLLDLNQSFGAQADQALPGAAIWRELIRSGAPSIISNPGVVIGNYWPQGYPEETADGRLRSAAASFVRNGHRDKLERHGVIVCEAEAYGQVLPAIDVAVAVAVAD